MGFFDRFLFDGTGKVLNALETMYAFDIERSDSCIEIGRVDESEVLKHMGGGVLYTISSALLGDVQGTIKLMMRSVDFDYLSELMKPVLSLLFLSSADADLKTLDSRKPDWMDNKKEPYEGDSSFKEEIMDAVAEMGNVLIGLYTKAIYNISALNTHHSMPELVRNPDQSSIQVSLTSAEISDRLLLIIKNELYVGDKPFYLWCVISLTQGSFQQLLNKMECNHGQHRIAGAQSQPVQAYSRT